MRRQYETNAVLIWWYDGIDGFEVYFKKNENGRKAEEVYEKLMKEVNDETQQADAGGKGTSPLARLWKHFQLRRDQRIRHNAAGEQDLRT